MDDDATIGTPVGPYGTVIEHPMIRGLFYMVVGPARNPTGTYDMQAIVLRDDSGFGYRQTEGSVIRLSNYLVRGDSSDWIVVE